MRKRQKKKNHKKGLAKALQDYANSFSGMLDQLALDNGIDLWGSCRIEVEEHYEGFAKCPVFTPLFDNEII